jgi:TPR repeat protein
MLKLSGKRALALGISILITIALVIYAAPQPIVHVLHSIHVPVPKPLQEFATDSLVAQLEKEAEAGDCHAQYDLAVRLHQRQFPKNWLAIAMQADARKWLVRSAEGGCTDAMTELGRYAYTAEDYREATKWYGKAANLGDPFAEWIMASYYEEGKGEARNLELALQWYKRAQESGFHAEKDIAGIYGEQGNFN